MDISRFFFLQEQVKIAVLNCSLQIECQSECQEQKGKLPFEYPISWSCANIKNCRRIWGSGRNGKNRDNGKIVRNSFMVSLWRIIEADNA